MARSGLEGGCSSSVKDPFKGDGSGGRKDNWEFTTECLCSLSASFSKERTLLWTECLCSPPPDSYVKTESPIDVLEAGPLEVD